MAKIAKDEVAAPETTESELAAAVQEGYEAPVPAGDKAPLFEFTDEEPPETASRSGKYDALVAACVANPSRWAKLPQLFSSGNTGNIIGKQYSEYATEVGGTLEVKKARVAELGSKPQFQIWVRFVTDGTRVG